MCGNSTSNLGLLLLGTLCYIGRSFTFDDIEEANATSREDNRSFFDQFVLYGSTVLYQKHVTVPAISTEPSKFEEMFASVGCNGCLGSTNTAHV